MTHDASIALMAIAGFTTRLLNSQLEHSAPRLERPGKFDTPPLIRLYAT